ncbi:hypothetical protein HanIR_Chr07g0337561 [Helianthus annuus]|nr:hypothetical protein HanIR_Chr07g0337561 [Helianthus annuus]
MLYWAEVINFEIDNFKWPIRYKFMFYMRFLFKSYRKMKTYMSCENLENSEGFSLDFDPSIQYIYMCVCVCV